MTIMLEGVYKPPTAHIQLEGIVFNHWPVTAQIIEISKLAGAAVGSAVVIYPSEYASDAAPEMGKWIRLKIGNQIVFRGVVGHGPYQIESRSDELQLVAFDDKWGMEANIIGQPGIGSQGDPAGSEGFQDVGFEVIFNRDGKPNKNASNREFDTGSSAVYWALGDIMLFLFDYYIDSTVAQIDADDLTSAYNRTPSHLCMIGQTALQAVDTVAQLAGQSWGLVPGTSHSQFTPVIPGAGTTRRVYLARPKGGQRVTGTTSYHASSCRAGTTIRNSRDSYLAVSSRIVKETTYKNFGDNPLLTGRGLFEDKEYYVRYDVDVTKYSANNLGNNLSAGSRPHPWLPHLVTRLTADGSDYVTKAQIDATPALLANERVQKPQVWVSPTDTDSANARLCTGGVRIDCDNATIDFKRVINLEPADAADPDDVEIPNWTNVGIWLTVATVLALPDSVQSSTDDEYLPRTFYDIIQKPDLVPERRQDAWLPDLTNASPNAITQVATSAEEKYVDVDARLTDAINSAIAASPAIESPLMLEFPFLPSIDIGNLIDVRGRNVGASGNEVVTEVSYKFVDGVPSFMKVQATNITVGVDPSQFVEAE